jgi:hypothetical protein
VTAFDPVHVPPLQVYVWRHRLLPVHAVPSCAAPLSTQTADPVEHEMTPAWQAVEYVQAVPAVQATHAPALQTMLVPHEVPFAKDVCWSVHVA